MYGERSVGGRDVLEIWLDGEDMEDRRREYGRATGRTERGLKRRRCRKRIG